MRPETVIDADGHITEPELVWTEYTSAAMRDRVLQVVTENGRSSVKLEGRSRGSDGPGPAEACIPGGMEPGANVTWADILPGGHDPHARIKVLDEEGIDKALFFPSIHLLWGDIKDVEVSVETCRACRKQMLQQCLINHRHPHISSARGKATTAQFPLPAGLCLAGFHAESETRVQ